MGLSVTISTREGEPPWLTLKRVTDGTQVPDATLGYAEVEQFASLLQNSDTAELEALGLHLRAILTTYLRTLRELRDTRLEQLADVQDRVRSIEQRCESART
jgi:hypothetical protein